jgi:ectoine hydroxylase-related dioxygenase (phytanoyl-CoA dioxygenase family)
MTADTVPSSLEVGGLGVMHLKRFWSTHRPNGISAPDDWDLDILLLNGLGVGIEPTLAYLFVTSQSVDDFENWIVRQRGSAPDAALIAKVNAGLSSIIDDSATPVIEQALDHDVLDAQDMQHWHAHGYVVLRDAAPPNLVADAEAALWSFLSMSADDPESWYRRSAAKGIMVPLYNHPALNAVRDSPRIRRAFEQLWGRTDLWCSSDRVSFNPPERSNWSFPGPDLHWDAKLQSPMPLAVQGLLYLTDTAPNQGAFTCVPGFQRKIDDWLGRLPEGADPQQQNLHRLGAKPISGRAGDFIFWHHALPHGASRNTSDKPRLVQYIEMRPTRAVR